MMNSYVNLATTLLASIPVQFESEFALPFPIGAVITVRTALPCCCPVTDMIGPGAIAATKQVCAVASGNAGEDFATMLACERSQLADMQTMLLGNAFASASPRAKPLYSLAPARCTRLDKLLSAVAASALGCAFAPVDGHTLAGAINPLTSRVRSKRFAACATDMLGLESLRFAGCADVPAFSRAMGMPWQTIRSKGCHEGFTADGANYLSLFPYSCARVVAIPASDRAKAT